MDKKTRILTLIPFFLTLLIIPFSMLTHTSLMDEANSATRVHSPLSRLDYLLTEFRVVITYIRLIFLPINQNLDYDYPIYYSLFTAPIFTSFLTHFVLIAIAIFLWRYSKMKSTTLRMTSFGIIWFYMALSVESSLIPISDVISENRLYLSSIGFIFSTVSLSMMTANNLKLRYPNVPTYSIVFCIVIIAVFTYATHKRNMVWLNPITLWEDVAKKSPHKARVLAQLGTQYSDIGDLDKAIPLLHRALNISPRNYRYHLNIGIAYFRKNMDDAALRHFTDAINLAPTNSQVLDCIGAVYYRKGLMNNAIIMFEKAIKYDPENVLAREHLFIALRGCGKEQLKHKIDGSSKMQEE